MNWRKEARLVADDASENSAFGYAVAIDGDTVVIGAPVHEADFMTGAVYVFTRDSSTGVWAQDGNVIMSGDSGFGAAMALQGDVFAAGSLQADIVRTYMRSGSKWSSFADITAPPDMTTPSFGLSLALSGTRLLVGAPTILGSPRQGSLRITAKVAIAGIVANRASRCQIPQLISNLERRSR